MCFGQNFIFGSREYSKTRNRRNWGYMLFIIVTFSNTTSMTLSCAGSSFQNGPDLYSIQTSLSRAHEFLEILISITHSINSNTQHFFSVRTVL